jgi:N-acetylglucosaminyl-diphospho-decaprenol L-rhamnosyltransferase
VVDNGSVDATMSIVKDIGVDKIVSSRINLGFGAAVNAGSRAAGRELLLVLNPDAAICAIDGDQLRALRIDKPTGIRACAIQLKDEATFLIRPARHWTLEMLLSLGHWFLLPREIALRGPRFSAKRRCVWAAGAALLVRTAEFEELGGFDDAFFLYFEDFDLSRTYRTAGLPIVGTEAVRVTHTGQQSSPRSEDRMIAHALLGLIEYVAKWHGYKEAQRAARICVSALALCGIAGSCLGRVPLVGRRASRKGASARAVLSFLASDARDRQAAQNTFGRRAFAAALHG